MDSPIIAPGDVVMLQLPYNIEDEWEEFKAKLEETFPSVQFWTVFGDRINPGVLWIYRAPPALELKRIQNLSSGTQALDDELKPEPGNWGDGWPRIK